MPSFFKLRVQLTVILISLMAVAAVVPVNQPPRVTILQPSRSTLVNPETPLSYQIEVNDHEDGSTKYEEITSSEVFLTVKLVGPNSSPENFIQQDHQREPVFRKLITESCFNCHSIQQKLSGPSFREIAEKYGSAPQSIRYLARKIQSGSKGVWSDSQQMPAHPHLSSQQAETLARQVIAYGIEKNLEFYKGWEGVITLPATPPARFTGVVLKASYLDHGVQGQDRKMGNHTLRLSFP